MMTYKEIEGYLRDSKPVVWLPSATLDVEFAIPIVPMGVSSDCALFTGNPGDTYVSIPMYELFPSLDAAKNEIDRRISAARGNELPTTVTKEKQQNLSWPDLESRVRKAIEDLKDAQVSYDGSSPCVDKYRAILDAELRLLEVRVKVDLAEIGQADRDRIMSKLAE